MTWGSKWDCENIFFFVPAPFASNHLLYPWWQVFWMLCRCVLRCLSVLRLNAPSCWLSCTIPLDRRSFWLRWLLFFFLRHHSCLFSWPILARNRTQWSPDVRDFFPNIFSFVIWSLMSQITWRNKISSSSSVLSLGIRMRWRISAQSSKLHWFQKVDFYISIPSSLANCTDWIFSFWTLWTRSSIISISVVLILSVTRLLGEGLYPPE